MDRSMNVVAFFGAIRPVRKGYSSSLTASTRPPYARPMGTDDRQVHLATVADEERAFHLSREPAR